MQVTQYTSWCSWPIPLLPSREWGAETTPGSLMLWWTWCHKQKLVDPGQLCGMDSYWVGFFDQPGLVWQMAWCHIHTATGILSFYNRAYTIDDTMLVCMVSQGLWTFTGKCCASQCKTGLLLRGSFKGVKLEVSVCDESYIYACSSMCLAFTLWICPQEFTPKISSPMSRHSSLHFVDPAKGVHMHPQVWNIELEWSLGSRPWRASVSSS